MRHRVKGRKLSRTASHRTATLRNLATSLLKHKKINTTSAKAKELKRFVEPMITKAKEGTVAARRHISRDIKDRAVLSELFSEIVEKVGERAGGYTRIVKLGNRLGDAAEMSIIELVDFSDLVREKKSKKVSKEKTKVEETAEVEDATVVEETVEAEEATEGKKKTKATAKAKEPKEKETKAKAKTKTKAEPKAKADTKAKDSKPKAATKKTSKKGS